VTIWPGKGGKHQRSGRQVPGLQATPSPNDTPVFILRGVGFYETSVAAYPDVAVYLDQTPLTLPAFTKLTMFDLERVEVLKGPQGTLFGNNATAAPSTLLRRARKTCSGRRSAPRQAALAGRSLTDMSRGPSPRT
jgi:outer membrane receptor for ferric coprogen and ferric-rhodotorulic acid